MVTHDPTEYMDLDDPTLPGSSRSSSPSSPSVLTIDSSPPSSPNIVPLGSAPSSPGLAHPFAASTKADRPPKIYEKRSRWDEDHSQQATSIKAHDHMDLGEGPSSFPPRGYTYVVNEREVTETSRMPQFGDLFAASAKGAWHPPRSERKLARVHSCGSAYSDASEFMLERATGSNFSLKPVSDNGEDTDTLSMTDQEDTHNNRPNRWSFTTDEDRGQLMWDEAITKAWDVAAEGGDIEVHMNDRSLLQTPVTYIPPSISDLGNTIPDVYPPGTVSFAQRSIANGLVPHKRPFTRSVTFPVSMTPNLPFLTEDGGRRVLMKSGSTTWVKPTMSSLTSRQKEIHLYLSNNAIRTLPVELFHLPRLTILILRSNMISVLPPQIAQLHGLRELDITFNKLSWLPAELLSMKIEDFRISGNPWMIPVDAFDDATGQNQEQVSDAGNSASSVEEKKSKPSHPLVHFTILPLSELCFRYLLSPASEYAEIARETDCSGKTVLEAKYALPLAESDKPRFVIETLRSCLPNAVAKPASRKISKSYFDDDVHTRRNASHPVGYPANVSDEGCDSDISPGIFVCPSSDHRTEDGAWVNERTPIFVHPAEERTTWERSVAGHDVSAECQGRGVPVRWRGCRRGCLNFLDTLEAAGAQEHQEDVEMTEFDGDGEQEQSVQVVQLGTGGLGDMEDFDIE
ncbi:uncharacterized protein LAESUDRAFT_812051 [Laetiporus sulphureus 93-53]|uniref:L domain-like protein n=1 Tax=Laetiporus sulphureus 93-53 TaxID=1314785 RepID=A0A165EMJ5_9APHY|nr:uncharacterized protein LAESUDRAFT_812051 [Laetiporus sulphureus 93-53]KZT07375.1 hypothetical protein LAESUDRAFT_812051 [Laetiporus sulphureus 93-53]